MSDVNGVVDDVDQAAAPVVDGSADNSGYAPLDGSVQLTQPKGGPFARDSGSGVTWHPLTDPALDQHYAGLANQYDPDPPSGVLGTFQQLPPDGITDRWRYTSPDIPGEPIRDAEGNPCSNWLLIRRGGQRGYYGLPSSTAPGSALVLPDQSRIPDATSPTGYLMSPYTSASNVAAAGRAVGATYRSMMNSNDPNSQEAAFANMIGAIGADLGTGGKFDYQRQGNFLTGFDHATQFRNIANFNVGLYMQQTGAFSLPEALSIAGAYARFRSSNAKPGAPYGLDPRQAQWITNGYQAGQRQNFRDRNQ